MSSAHLHIDSFNAGEVSPLVSSRFGVEKVASGCRTLKNFIIHPHGPAFRRPGMEYMGDAATNDSTRPPTLRSFQFSSSTVFVLELSELTEEELTPSTSELRVWHNGTRLTLLTPVLLPYDASELQDVQMNQVNDVIYLTHPKHEPRRLTRWANNDWRLTTIPWKSPPLLDENPGEELIHTFNVSLNQDPTKSIYTNWTHAYPSNEVTLSGAWTGGPHRLVFEEEAITGVWREVIDFSWFGGSPTFPYFVWGVSGVTGNRRAIYSGHGQDVFSSPLWYIRLGGSNLMPPGDPWPLPNTATIASGLARVTVSCVAQTGRQARYVSLQSRVGGTGSWITQETWDVRQTLNRTKEFIVLASTQFRFVNDGTSNISTLSAPMTGGPTFRLESAVPNSPYNTAVSVSDPSVGPLRSLMAAAPLFRSGHIGSCWQLTHRREDAFVQLNPTSAAVAAKAKLVFAGNAANAQTVTIGSRIYSWVTTLTAATSNTLKVGATQADSMNNLVAAINCLSGTGAGTLYGNQTAPHPDVSAEISADPLDGGNAVVITARKPGIGTHNVAVTDTMSNAAWDQVFLHDGVAANTVITAAETPGIRVNGTWEVTTYGSWATTLYLERLTASGTWEFVRSWRANKDRNVSTTGITDGEETLRLRILTGTSEETSTAASPRFLLEAVDGRVNGLVKITAVPTSDPTTKSVTATCVVISPCWSTAPTYVWTEGAFSEHQGFPTAVTFHESRLWFAGTKMQPMRLWGSVTGDIENFRRSSLDDGSLSFTPSAGELNPICWLQSQGSDLVVGTSGDEWTLNGDGRPLAPTNVNFQLQSRYGSSSVPALMAGEVVVFVQRGGRKLRRISSRSDNTPWATADLTVLAEHIALDGITQMAFGSNPNSILWAVTRSGKLIGMTLETEQNVFGWHRHETDGFVESIAVVYGSVADEVWLSVRRGTKRCIERLDPQVFARDFTAYQTMIYADSAKRHTFGLPGTVVPGLSHLEGKNVCVLADGVQRPNEDVIAGQITISPPATDVIVGLPYTSELQPTRREIQTQKGSAQGMLWRTSRVMAYVHESHGGKVAASPTSLEEAWPYETTTGLYSGPLETAVESHASPSMDVVLRTSAPLPFNVGALVAKLDLYGD